MRPINVKKILVPTDFSCDSLNALQYAAAIAKKQQAEIHLLYVDDFDHELFRQDNFLQPPSLQDYMNKLSVLTRGLAIDNEVICSYSFEHGGITHSILKTAISLGSDLIIMGKNGSNGHSTEYAGTNTCQVAEKSKIPVIVVPGNISNFSVSNILFPVRALISAIEKYDDIRPFIIKSKAALTILNLRDPEHQNELHIIHHLSLILKKRLEADNLEYAMNYYFRDNHFAEHILATINKKENEFDLAVITSEIDRSNKDFHISHYTQRIIHQSPVPVLVIHPDEAKLEADEVLRKLECEVSMD